MSTLSLVKTAILMHASDSGLQTPPDVVLSIVNAISQGIDKYDNSHAVGFVDQLEGAMHELGIGREWLRSEFARLHFYPKFCVSKAEYSWSRGLPAGFNLNQFERFFLSLKLGIGLVSARSVIFSKPNLMLKPESWFAEMLEFAKNPQLQLEFIWRFIDKLGLDENAQIESKTGKAKAIFSAFSNATRVYFSAEHANYYRVSILLPAIQGAQMPPQRTGIL